MNLPYSEGKRPDRAACPQLFSSFLLTNTRTLQLKTTSPQSFCFPSVLSQRTMKASCWTSEGCFTRSGMEGSQAPTMATRCLTQARRVRTLSSRARHAKRLRFLRFSLYPRGVSLIPAPGKNSRTSFGRKRRQNAPRNKLTYVRVCCVLDSVCMAC